MNKKAQARTIPIIRKNKTMKNKLRLQIKERLRKLDTDQLKIFYAMIVHCRAHQKSFISTQNLFNLWCELNQLCYEFDNSFPNPHDDHKLLKDFCLTHPYYFIDIIDLQLVKNLFCKHLDDRIDILSAVVNKLITEGIHAAYERSNVALGLNENVDDLVDGTVKYLNSFI